ncbi:MAG: hypothetical protein KF823_03170 [Xanthomonadales bacterium]|nr:hypothetical protein [Xanthomonadales bacterium]
MLRRLLLLAAGSLAQAAQSQPTDPAWQVVLANSGADLVLPALLPAPASFELRQVSLGDADGGIGFTRWTGSSQQALWAQRLGTLVPYAELLATGQLGPGRTGAESGHAFRTLWWRQDAGAGPHRVFGARAGDPTQPVDAATFGIWTWNGQRNLEIARLAAAGALAPGFDPGIEFTSFGNTASAGYPNARALPDGRTLIQASVTGGWRALVAHSPGTGNRGCLLEGSSHPAWSPGIEANAFFHAGANGSLIQFPAAGSGGEVLVAAAWRVTGSGSNRFGVFRICAGPPTALALSGVSGAQGPGLADPGAVITEFGSVRAGYDGSAFFWARGTGAGGSFIGGFHHAGGLNRPLWLNGTQGDLGPGYATYSFDQGSAPILQAAGGVALLNTTIRPAAGTTSVRGLWRIVPGQSPQPLAIVGDTGAYSPAPGRAWRSFAHTQVLDDGTVLILAEVGNPVAVGVWRLTPGAAPVQVLAVGDPVRVPTPSGLQMRAVTGIIDTFFDTPEPGIDGWASRQGELLVRANVEGLPGTAQVVLRGRPARGDRLFGHGFD